MMTAERWAPGTVATATVRGEQGVRVMRVDDHNGPNGSWRSATRADQQVIHLDEHVTDIRPLVVLDLDKPEYVAQLIRNTATGNTLRDLADQIDEQVNPRTPEPGLWSVVRDSNTHHWVCHEPHRWFNMTTGQDWPWVDIRDPVIVHECAQ